MANFLYSAVDARGASTTGQVTARSVDDARDALEKEGYTDIKFLTGDLEATFDERLGRLNEGAPAPADILTPKQQLEARREGGVLRTIWFAWKANSIFWIPLFLWNGFSFLEGRPFSLWDWLGFGLSILFLVYFVWIAIPGVVYQRLLEASMWRRGNDVRRWVKLIRTMKRLAFIPLPELELDFRLASVLAFEGRLEEALQLLKPYEEHKCGKFLYYGRLGDVYSAARDYGKMTEMQRLAAEHGSGNPAERLDVALGLVRRHRNPREAEAILAELPPEDNSGEVVGIFTVYCRGLIAVEDRQWAVAEQRLMETINRAGPYLTNPIVDAMINSDVKAYLALALASQGLGRDARRALKEAEPLLRARGETELLDRCHTAIEKNVIDIML
jgi:hypothetical protein